MEDEVGLSISMAVSIMLTAILITIIASYASLSYKAYNTKLRADSVVDYLGLKSKFYSYDGKEVKGSDIVDIIENNARMYTFEIDTSHGNYIISVDNERELAEKNNIPRMSVWSAKYIKEILGDDIVNSKFKAELIGDKTDYVITGIKFIKEEAN